MNQHDYSEKLYKSKTWQKCRAAYISSVGGLCERCYKNGIVSAGTQLHHKIKLTEDNINDPSITLNYDNLELLCERCHKEEHTQRRWRVDEMGRMI